MRIDIHAHALPEETMRQMQAISKAHAPRLERGVDSDTLVVGDFRYPKFPCGGWDTATRLEAMAKSGVDAQAVAQPPMTFLYELDSKLALEFSQAQNEGLARLMKQNPGKFYPLCAVPLQDPEAAAAELERAVRQLGLFGVETGTNVAGRNLDDLMLEPFYRKLAELGCFWLIHPWQAAPMDRMGSYYMINIVGFPLETTVAVASLIFGGVIERHPQIRVCTCHAGGFVPYQYGRFDHGFEVRAEAKAVIKKKPSEYLRAFYFDTITHSRPVLEYLVRNFGPEHVMLGTDYPFDMGVVDPVGLIGSLESTDAAGKALIEGGNAAKLLGIRA